MRYLKNIQGSAELAIPLVVDKDTVYVKENIHPIIIDDGSGNTTEIYEWDEYQYTKEEYQILKNIDNLKLQADIDYLAIMMGVDLNV